MGVVQPFKTFKQLISVKNIIKIAARPSEDLIKINLDIESFYNCTNTSTYIFLTLLRDELGGTTL